MVVVWLRAGARKHAAVGVVRLAVGGYSPDTTFVPANMAPGHSVPVELSNVQFVDASGQFVCGVWKCGPHETVVMPYPANEFCQILSGSVTIRDAKVRCVAVARKRGRWTIFRPLNHPDSLVRPPH